MPTNRRMASRMYCVRTVMRSVAAAASFAASPPAAPTRSPGGRGPGAGSGCWVVVGSGNEGSIAVDEPAALPGVIAVGAHDKDGNVWEGSNTGRYLDLVVPGAEILAADMTRSQKCAMSNGTSDAAAILRSMRSTHRACLTRILWNQLCKACGPCRPAPTLGVPLVAPTRIRIRRARTSQSPAGVRWARLCAGGGGGGGGGV
ncbi:S8 family serine peptidase [Streptomyces chartreusis]|uniref:S8 family serine peptidase n=1 Tax=Streptomyces chartreusis TaxID=1969 RepID=UPI0036681AE8